MVVSHLDSIAWEIEQHVTQRLETWLATSPEVLEPLALSSNDTAIRTALVAGRYAEDPEPSGAALCSFMALTSP